MSERNTPLSIREQTVAPGKTLRLELPASSLPSGAEATVPLVVVNGRYAGPTIWLSAAIHGDEVNGVEVIRRVLSQVSPKALHGRILAVPIVNVFGFAEGMRYLPDRRDLNRSFPGSPRGSLASRLAHLFMTEVVDRCELGIDLHTGADSRSNLPQVRADMEDPETARLARAFGAPAILNAGLRDGSLRAAAGKRGKPCLLYEAGEARRFDRWAIQGGLKGVMRVLGTLGMVESEQVPTDPVPEAFEATTSRWVRAGRAGVLHLEAELGDEVQEGQVLGYIANAFGRGSQRVKAPFAGLVVGAATNPVVYRGDAVLHVARR